MTHGCVGQDAAFDVIVCPQCGEDVNSRATGDHDGEGGEKMAVPRYIRADIERALLHAYYQHVCQCESVHVDHDSRLATPWAAVGITASQAWLADFSSLYEFPADMKPSTVARRIRERVADARRLGAAYLQLWEASGNGAPVRAIYEVWCFQPPSRRLLDAWEGATAGEGQVVLVMPEEIDARIRETVRAVPSQGDDQAFTQAAVMIRRAFGL